MRAFGVNFPNTLAFKESRTPLHQRNIQRSPFFYVRCPIAKYEMYAQLGQISKIILHLYVVIPPLSPQNRYHTPLSMSTSLLLTLPSFDRIRNVRPIGAKSLNTLIFICGVLPSEPAKFAPHPLNISTSLLRSLPNTPPIPQPHTKYTRSPGKHPKGSSILNTVEPVEASET